MLSPVQRGRPVYIVLIVLTDYVKQLTSLLCMTRELLSLLGHLNYANRLIIHGRSFVFYLLTLAHSVKELHYHVPLNRGCRDDFKMGNMAIMFSESSIIPKYSKQAVDPTVLKEL
jgi:hypothetical protein